MTDDKIKKIPPGYKQTELGVIPEDWEVKKLGEVVTKIQTGGKNNEDKTLNGKYPFFVRSQIIEKINSFSYDCEAILVPGEGQIGEIFHYINGKFDAHQRVYVIRGFNGVYAQFVFYYLVQFFRHHALKNTVKATVDSLRLPVFLNFEISLPPLPEQQAIAWVLSDVDELIESLSKLIEKQKNIKIGAMQELLTGKRRLPGFGVGRGYKQTELGVIPEDWEVKRLGDIFKIRTKELNYKNLSTYGKFYLVEMGNISEYGQLLLSKKVNYGDFLKKDDLVMPTRDIGEGRIIGKVTIIDENDKYVVGNNIYVLRLIADQDVGFLHYLINSNKINSSLRAKTSKSVQLALNKRDVFFTKFFLPPLPEQQAIARVLSDMDEEVEALEKKKAKYENLKKAMMQVLLTGKIRLKNFAKV